MCGLAGAAWGKGNGDMGSGGTSRPGRQLWLAKLPFVVATCFAAGLVTAGVVSGAGPLAMLSSTEETETSSESTETTTAPAETAPTDTTPTETAPTETAGVPCAQTGDEIVLTDRSDYDPGATVFMTGSGYAASCDVTVKVTRPDGSIVKGDGSFDPGSDVITTGVDGTLAYAYVLDGIQGEYLIEVTGADETVLATTTFYDAISEQQEGGAITGSAAFSGTCLNAGNAHTANDNRALCDEGENVVGSEFELASLVPADAVGLSFSVSVEGIVSDNDGSDVFQIALSSGGPFTANTATSQINGEEADSTVFVPSSTSCSDFGRSWTLSDISDANFRVRVTADMNDASGETMSIDDIDVAICNDGSIVREAALSAGINAVASPGGTLIGEVEVNHSSIGGGDNNWRSTSYQFEGEDLECVNTVDHDNNGTDRESFEVIAPSNRGIYDVTFVAYNNDTCAPNANDSLPFTLTDAVTVGVFGDSFGVDNDNSYTDAGWTDGDGNGIDCSVQERGGVLDEANAYLRLRSQCIQTRSGLSTAGLVGIHLKYLFGQQTNNDGSDDGDLVVQWKRADSGTWLTLHTHDLANNTTTNPVTPFDFLLPDDADDTTIDIRFFGDTDQDNDQARVDDVLVTGVANSAPVAVDDPYTTNEDTNLGLDAVAAGPNSSPVDNDTDADDDTLTVTSVSNPAGGSVNLGSGTITFTPTPGLCGVGEGGFDYVVSDGNGGQDTGRVTVDITCVDDPPTAEDDTATLAEDSDASALDVLTNDTDPDGGPKTIESVTPPGNGIVLITGGGTGVTYEPAPDYCNDGFATDDFTYTLNGGSSATVAVTVTCVNDAPVCQGVSITTDEDTANSTAPNCADVDNPLSSLTYEVAQPANGVASDDDIDLTFDPNGQYEGLDTGETNVDDGDFTYTANDGDADSEPADVAVTVNGVNDAPVCDDVTLTTNEDTPGATAPACTDVDEEPLTYIVGPATTGISGTSGGDLTYDPDGKFESLDTTESDSDSFTYEASDTTANSNTANAAVTITGVNDAPMCDSVAISVSEDGPAGTSAPDCTDVDEEPLTYSVTDPAQGASSVLLGQLRFDPDGDFEGLDTAETDTTNGDFGYQADDGDALSTAAGVEVTVNGVNDAPVCQDVSITTDEDTVGSTAPDCTDVDLEPVMYTVTQPSLGASSVLAGQLRFDPDGDFEGLDTAETDTTNGDFTYQADDGDALSTAAGVEVTVIGVNDAPVCEDVTLTTDEDTAGSTAPDCTDVDDEPLAISVVTPPPPPVKGIASYLDPNLRFNPNGQFEGLDTGETDTTNGDFRYTASDGDATSTEANVEVTVNGVNDAPVCQDVTLTTDENTVGTTAPACTDVDDEPLTYTVGPATTGISGTSGGDLTYDPDGRFESLDTTESDSDSFTYEASDGTASSNTANVAVTITGVNDAPVCLDRTLTTNEDTVGSVAASCTDVDDEPLTISVVTPPPPPAKGIASYLDPNLRFDPNGQFEGLDTGETDTTNGDFRYTASDSDATSTEANVQVTVNGVNDAPVCQDVSLTTDENTVGTTAPACTDVDDEPLTYTVTQPTLGTSSVLMGQLRFDPDGDFEALNVGDTDTTNGDFTYKASDSTANSNVAAVAVTVTGVNDGPVLTVTPGSVTAQYSDPIDGDAGTAGVQPVSISTTDVDTPGTALMFAVKDALPGCSALTALPDDLVKTDGVGNATLPGTRTATISGVLDVAPATYARCIEVTDGGGGRDTEAFTVTVTKEDADATYTGDMLAFTPPGGSSANVVLRATIRDSSLYTSDATPGDIRNAVVVFKEGATTLCTFVSPLPLLNPLDTRAAAVECSKSFSLGEHTISIYVNGSYYAGTGAGVVEVSQPDGSFITGGGYILTSTSSPAGKYAADPGSRMNYGFNVKYNKNKTNLQGHLNVIFRRTVAGELRSYQIKANAMDSLGIALKNGSSGCAGPPSATCWGLGDFRSKANLTDVTNPAASVSMGGNLTVQVTITDQGEPGKNDSIGVTLWQGSTLLFSSEWNGAKTVEKVVEGGNLVVH